MKSLLLSLFLSIAILSPAALAEIPEEVRAQLREDVKGVLAGMRVEGSVPSDEEVDGAFEEFEASPQAAIFEFSKSELKDFTTEANAPKNAEITKGFADIRELTERDSLPKLLAYYSQLHTDGKLSTRQKFLCKRMIDASLEFLRKQLDEGKDK